MYTSSVKSSWKREREKVDKKLMKSKNTEAKAREENIIEGERDDDEIDKET